jgi:hypothetical protein
VTATRNLVGSNDTADGTGVLSGGTATFTAESIGTASSDRKLIIVATGTVNGSSPASPTMTVDGNAATADVINHGHGSSGGNNHALVSIFSLDYPSGTTADIVVTPNMNMFDVEIFVYAATGLAAGGAEHTAGGTDAGTGQTSLSADVQTSAGAVVIGGTGSYQHNSADPGNFSWTGLTDDAHIGLYSNTNYFRTGGADDVSAENPRAITGVIQAYGNADQSFGLAVASYAAAAGGGGGAAQSSVGIGLTQSLLINPRSLAA